MESSSTATPGSSDPPASAAESAGSARLAALLKANAGYLAHMDALGQRTASLLSQLQQQDQLAALPPHSPRTPAPSSTRHTATTPPPPSDAALAELEAQNARLQALLAVLEAAEADELTRLRAQLAALQRPSGDEAGIRQLAAALAHHHAGHNRALIRAPADAAAQLRQELAAARRDLDLERTAAAQARATANTHAHDLTVAREELARLRTITESVAAQQEAAVARAVAAAREEEAARCANTISRLEADNAALATQVRKLDEDALQRALAEAARPQAPPVVAPRSEVSAKSEAAIAALSGMLEQYERAAAGWQQEVWAVMPAREAVARHLEELRSLWQHEASTNARLRALVLELLPASARPHLAATAVPPLVASGGAEWKELYERESTAWELERHRLEAERTANLQQTYTAQLRQLSAQLNTLQPQPSTAASPQRPPPTAVANGPQQPPATNGSAPFVASPEISAMLSRLGVNIQRLAAALPPSAKAQ